MPRQRFSDRYEFTTPREIFQLDNIDAELRNRIWNIVKNDFIDVLVAKYNSDDYQLDTDNDKLYIVNIYDAFFKDHIDPLQLSKKRIRDDIKHRFFALKWFNIYNFLEFLAYTYHSTRIDYFDKVNKILEEENSGYRFIDEFITPIIDEIEIVSIEDALESEYPSVKQHLSKALELFSDKESPDYTNSIKESISTVESLCKQLIGNSGTPLGSCLSQLDIAVGKHFKQGVTKLYNWTSSDGGIRHGATDESIEASFDEAKYMLVICSAFVNYMISKSN